MSKLIRPFAAAVLCGAFLITLAGGGAASGGWEERSLVSPVGDKLNGLAVRSSNEPDFVLAIACDGERGDRWRGVAVLQLKTSPQQLENPRHGMTKRQRVDIAFSGGRPASDTFQISKTPNGDRLFWAPEPSKFARNLLDTEKASPSAALEVTLRLAKGQPLNVSFPLAGLNADFAGLSKRCRNWQP